MMNSNLQSHSKIFKIALLGNPNSGKTAIFNLLTKLRHKVSNYPGVTVEQKMGIVKLNNGRLAELLDLPGTYSLTPESLDEKIVAEEVTKWVHGIHRPDAIISVVDASNLSRNLYLTTQLTDLGIPVVMALNMMDLVKSGTVDHHQLSEKLGIHAAIPMSAKEKWGVNHLLDGLWKVLESPPPDCSFMIPLNIPAIVSTTLEPLTSIFKENFQYSPRLAVAQALRVITRNSALELYRKIIQTLPGLDDNLFEKLIDTRREIIGQLESLNYSHRILEATLRYAMIDDMVKSIQPDNEKILKQVTRSEKADRILTHKWLGPAIFISIMYIIFHSVFTLATIPMDWIDESIHKIGDIILRTMGPGMLRDLLVDGVFGGVGAILVFLPQILILVFFLSMLEDSGYMARVAFLLDRFMTKVGLHGRSALPLISGYACAIPGIMASRTIDSWKERLITILILPLMSCSARLPVYSLLIGAFIPAKLLFGFISLQGFTLVTMYILGTVVAFILAWIFSKFIPIQGKSSFVMEMPPYRIPIMGSVFHQVFTRAKLFLKNAGQIILAISIVLWFIASFPSSPNSVNGNHVEDSYAGKIGKIIEPVIKPLGFDWKIGIGLVTSFAAREVMVSTLATLYSVDNGENSIVHLSSSLVKDINIHTGKQRYDVLFALSLMVFYVFAAQCMATFAIVKVETNSWKWPIFMICYMSMLAYGASFLVYQGGRLLGF